MTKRQAPFGARKSAFLAEAGARSPTMADDDASNPTLYWGPGGPPENCVLVESWTPGSDEADTWGPYHQVLFPPHEVTPWIRFKIMTSGVNIARRMWAEREALRADYEVAHGVDPEAWPHNHPAVVLESVQSVAHAACLGCQWLDRGGTSMSAEDWRTAAARVGHRHFRSYSAGGMTLS